MKTWKKALSVVLGGVLICSASFAALACEPEEAPAEIPAIVTVDTVDDVNVSVNLAPVGYDFNLDLNIDPTVYSFGLSLVNGDYNLGVNVGLDSDNAAVGVHQTYGPVAELNVDVAAAHTEDCNEVTVDVNQGAAEDAEPISISVPCCPAELAPVSAVVNLLPGAVNVICHWHSNAPAVVEPAV